MKQENKTILWLIVSTIVVIMLFAFTVARFVIPSIRDGVKETIDYAKEKKTVEWNIQDTVIVDRCGDTQWVYIGRKRGYKPVICKELDTPKLIPITKLQ